MLRFSLNLDTIKRHLAWDLFGFISLYIWDDVCCAVLLEAEEICEHRENYRLWTSLYWS